MLYHVVESFARRWMITFLQRNMRLTVTTQLDGVTTFSEQPLSFVQAVQGKLFSAYDKTSPVP